MLTDRVIFVLTVIIAVVYLYASTQIPVLAIGDPLGPKVFPQLLGVALLISAGLLAREMWLDSGKKAVEAEEADTAFDMKVIPVLVAIVLWTGIYYLSFEWLGYMLGTALYLLPMTMWFNRRHWLANVLSTVFFVVFTYYLFVELEVRLPAGILPL